MHTFTITSVEQKVVMSRSGRKGLPPTLSIHANDYSADFLLISEATPVVYYRAVYLDLIDSLSFPLPSDAVCKLL